MTDPLSVSASILAVLSAGISVSKAINTVIQGYREAPVAITALSNEVSDLIVVLQEVRDRNLDSAAGGSLIVVLSRADERLEELRVFIWGLGVVDQVGKWRRSYERARWVEKKKRALELKCGLRDVKGNVVLLLNSEILSQVKSTKTAVETISKKIEATTLKDERHQNEMSTHLLAYGLRFSEVLDPIQKMVEEQQNQRQILQRALAACATLKIPRLIDPKAEVFRLVAKGDVENMKYLFRNGLSSPNDLNGRNGRSLLLLAFIYGQVEMSEFLLEAGTDPYIEDFHGRNAAEYAQGLIIRNGYQSYGTPWGSTGALSQLAKQFSLDYSVARRRKFSRFHKAVVQDNAQKLRQELELSRKDIDGQDTDGLTPLHLAVYRANADSVELLLACGADLGIYDKHGFYILEKLLWQRYEDETELLRQDRCLQSIISHYGWKKYGKSFSSHGHPEYHSVLDQACWANRHTAVAMLLAAGAQIRDPEDSGRSALDTCVRCNHHESLELILREKKQLENLTKGAWLWMLDFARGRSDARTVKILTEAQLVIDRLDSGDWKRLATIPSISDWNTWDDQRSSIKEFRRWKSLYKGFIEGLRLRAGFDPVLSPLAWSGGEDELGEEDGDDEFEDDSETDKEGDPEQEDEEFEDAVEYHDG